MVRTVLRALLFFAAMSAHASGISVKFADLIRQYDGTGDFLEWLEKLELVAALQNVADLEKFLPLFLSGGTFAVYKSLTDVAKIIRRSKQPSPRLFPQVPSRPTSS